VLFDPLYSGSQLTPSGGNMLQVPIYSANELREIHEERIAPFLQRNVADKPKEGTEQAHQNGFFNLIKRVVGIE
jgi:hypothetical protein